MQVQGLGDFNSRIDEISVAKVTKKDSLENKKIVKKVDALVTELASVMKDGHNSALLKEQAYRLVTVLRNFEQVSPELRAQLFRLESNFGKEFHPIAPSFSSADYKKRNMADIKALFGAERLPILATRYADFGGRVDLNKDRVTDKEFDLLLMAAADVRSKDVEQLWNRIKTEPPPTKIDRLSVQQTKQLIQAFEGKERLEDLSKDEMNILIEVLAPFESPEDVFSGKFSKPPDINLDSGRTLEGIRERVYVQLQLRFMSVNLESQALQPSDPLRADTEDVEHIKWATTLAKQLTTREPPIGLIIPHPNGFYQVHSTVYGAGALKVFMRTYSKQEDQFINVVSCRGTTVKKGGIEAKGTVLEDLRQNLGSKGPLITERATHAFLSDPDQGFVKTPDEKVHYIGFSLGGGHAMRDACLHFEHLSRLTTISAAAVDDATAEWFKNKVNSTDFEQRLDITHVIDLPDRVHFSGDVRLGIGCDPKKARVRMLAVERTKEHKRFSLSSGLWTGYEMSHNALKAVLEFLRALVGPHVEVAFLNNVKIFLLDNTREGDLAGLERALHNRFLDPRGYKAFEAKRRKFGRMLEKLRVLDRQREWDFADRLNMPRHVRMNLTDGAMYITRQKPATIIR